MPVSIKSQDKEFTAFLSGEIDHHSAPKIREKIDSHLNKEKPQKLILDFSGVSFMDSSGVGLVMGRYKNALHFNCSTYVCGLRERDLRIMKMSGLEKLVEFR